MPSMCLHCAATKLLAVTMIALDLDFGEKEKVNNGGMESSRVKSQLLAARSYILLTVSALLYSPTFDNASATDYEVNPTI